MSINNLATIKKFILFTLILLSVINISACSSPEDKANEFYESGMRFLEAGELEKADIEFRNALQIDRTMIKAMWGQVLTAEKKSNPRQAFKVLSKIINLNPDHLGALVKLGRIYLIAGKLDKALEMSEKAINISGMDLSVMTLRAAVLLQLDNREEAISIASKVIKKDPMHVDALMVLATERIISNDPASAIKYLDQGLRNSGRNISLQLIKIQALEKLGKNELAEDVYKRLILNYPDIHAFSYTLAHFYLKSNRKDDAEKVLRDVISNNPDNHNAKMKLINFLLIAKDKDKAQNQLEIFLARNPDNYDLMFSLVRFYIGRNSNKLAYKLLDDILSKNNDEKILIKAKEIKAGLHLKEGEKETAEIVINDILSQDKRNENALILKAMIHIERLEFDAAIASMRIVLRDNPNSSRALFNIAKAYNLSGSIELADEQYFNAFKASKYNAAYGIKYAEFLQKNNNIKKAEKILATTTEVSPDNISALRMLAKIRLLLGDWLGAQAVADKIRQQGDSSGIAGQIEGAILSERKKYDESISTLMNSYQSVSNKKQSAVSLVRAYLLAGKSNEARKFVDSLIKANPDNINAWALSGQLHYVDGNIQSSINSYNEIIKRRPESSLGYYLLSTIYIKINEIKEAREILMRGLSFQPDSYSLLTVKASLHQSRKEYDESIEAYEKILLLKPDMDIAANNLASLLLEARKDKETHNRAYKISLRFKKSEIPQFRDTYGWASYHVEKFEEANIALEYAATKLASLPEVHYHLGMNYLALDKAELARKALEKALSLSASRPIANKEKIMSILENL